MIEETVRARKDHKCDMCEKPIKKGTIHVFGKTRGPRFENEYPYDKQVGIEYVSWRFHLEHLSEDQS